MKKAKDVETYIAGFPAKIQVLLEQIRATIKKTAPGATEIISYGMPAYKLNGILLWFGAHTNHIGLYPKASGIAAFKKELAGYQSAKGSVQFPIDKPIPLDLVKRIVKYRLVENLQKLTKDDDIPDLKE